MWQACGKECDADEGGLVLGRGKAEGLFPAAVPDGAHDGGVVLVLDGEVEEGVFLFVEVEDGVPVEKVEDGVCVAVAGWQVKGGAAICWGKKKEKSCIVLTLTTQPHQKIRFLETNIFFIKMISFFISLVDSKSKEEP